MSQTPELLRRLLRAKDRMDQAPHEAWPVARLAEVSAAGVEFNQEPVARYGTVDAGFRDPSGNGWKMIERSAGASA